MSLSLVILAAGQGKRMNSALPKVLQPLAGKPLLKHVLDCAAGLPAATSYVVYGHGGEAVRNALAVEPVHWVLQAERLGTGHAVMQALSAEPRIPDDHQVLVLYGDVPLIRHETLNRLIDQAGSGGRVGILSVLMDDPSGYGRIVRDGAGHVVRIVEQKDATTAELGIREVNTGIMVLPAGRLRGWLKGLRNDNAQGEYYLTDVVAAAVAERTPVDALIAPTVSEVLGINDRLQLAEAEAAHRRRETERLMRLGATIVDPTRLDVRGEVTVGRDVYIDVNVVLVGRVKLGDGVKLGAGSVIKDCEIGAGTEVFPHCVLEQAVIGPECNVGPFARLRPGARLEQGVHIGNFVEVKNSRLGEGSKANHLSYVGDAEVGSKVNIGAGTIVANYDGANKHRSIIEDEVHTGSNSVLVAPITVERGATVGAGSTVTKRVPAGKLTLARARQTTIGNWRRPVKKSPKDRP